MKYLIFDLDDTLLNNFSEISLYTQNGIKKMRDMGYIIVINTARSFKATEKYINLIKPDYSILNGGVCIYDSNNKMIFESIVKSNIVNEIVSFILNDKDSSDFSIQCSDYLYTSSIEYVQRNSNFAKYFDFTTDLNMDACKILVSTNNKEKYRKLAKKYNLDFTDYLGGQWCRICNSEKYLGNVALFKYLNDSDPQDFVFGDDVGDMLMIKNAYHGVIMKNARLELKQNLNVTNYSNDEDGVIRYMEELHNVN